MEQFEKPRRVSEVMTGREAEQKIDQAKTFEDLYDVLRDVKVIQGTERTYKAEELIENIEQLRKEIEKARKDYGSEWWDEGLIKRSMQMHKITSGFGVRRAILRIFHTLAMADTFAEMLPEDGEKKNSEHAA